MEKSALFGVVLFLVLYALVGMYFWIVDEKEKGETLGSRLYSLSMWLLFWIIFWKDE